MTASTSTYILFLVLFVSTGLALSIPAILPPVSSLKHDENNKIVGVKAIILGCAASFGIGALFGSMFLVWLGLVIYHSAAALFASSEDPEETAENRNRRRKVKSRDRRGWTKHCTAGHVLGTVFGLIFAVWGSLFVWNMVDAVGILRDLTRLRSLGELAVDL